MRWPRRRPRPVVDNGPSTLTAALTEPGWVFAPTEHDPVPRPDGHGFLQARDAVVVRTNRTRKGNIRLRWLCLGVEVRTPAGWELFEWADDTGTRFEWPAQWLETWPPCWCLGTGRQTDGTRCPECPNGQA